MRVNFSQSKVNQTYFIDTFGGAIVPPQSSLYPSFTNGGNGYIYIEVNPTGSNTLSDGLFSDNRQQQFNIVNSTSYTIGKHDVKFGVDYRRLTPVSYSGNYKRSFTPDSIEALINNTPTSATLVAPQVTLRPIYNNFSAFAQDNWRVNNRLTLTYGLRYEVVPAPDEKNGNLPLTVLGLQKDSYNLANISLSPDRKPFYETTYNNFAPRIGAAFQPFGDGKTVVRGGFGVFYDLGYGFTGSAFSTGVVPFSSTLALSGVTYDSPVFQQQVPPFSLTPPFTRVFAYQPEFKTPYSLQYNFAVEHSFGANDTVSISYVGARGKRLGRVETLRAATGNFRRLDLVTNGGHSNYNSLQAQYQRRFSRGLQVIASYTFAKSLDNVSEESQNNLQSPTGRFEPNNDYAPSNFDVRHAFNSAVGYEIPSPVKNGIGRKLFGGFGLDLIARARTATPINIVSGANSLVEGAMPIYNFSAAAPGNYLLTMERNWSFIKIESKKFEDYLREDGMEYIIGERAKLGEQNKEGHERYSRYLKSLLQVGGKNDKTYKKNLGMKLEIVPLENPYAKKIGDNLRFQVFFDGKPLADRTVFADNRTAETQKMTTDKNGKVTMKIDKSGLWLVRLVNMRRCAADCGEADWESFWTALSFQAS